MDKLKKFVKHLFAPAIVLLLVVIMGVFSPVMSVAAALRVNAIVHNEQFQPVISNLPARTVEVNTEIKKPTINPGAVELYHAGVKVEIPEGDNYTYQEVGQYEWRFYVNDVLFNTQKVIVTEATYTMSMVDNVVTVAPKDLKTLNLPLPNTYRVDGKAIAVASIEKGTADIHGGSYVIITDEDGKVYTLTATVALENHTFAASKISFDKNGIAIDLSANKTTGNLKVAYQLCNEDGTKDLAILPLKDIEIKNVNKSDVTFANIPDAPSVKNLAYYSSINLTAPTAGSAKVGVTSFNVDAQTKIFKIQCSPYKTEPSDWSKTSDSKIHTLDVEKNSDGDWVVKENGTVTDAYVEVDGLTVKVKKLGWYRFQFETSTLFGYQLDETVDVDDLNIQQDDAKSYVRYWSNSVHISSDQDKPSFAFVKPYDDEDADVINEMNENFSDLISDYKNYLPMTSQSDSLKVTVNEEGLVLPAIFPHDNATAYNDMSIYSFSISQLRDEDGEPVSNNYVRLGDDDSKTTFVYDQSKRLQVLFVENEAERGCENNNVKLLKSKGLYQISITVKESEAKYENGDVGGYARSNTQSYYFYFDESYTCGVSDSNSPVVDADNKFQISDLYLWEGKTLEFPKPYFSDAHTATNKIQSDYFLVGKKGSAITVLSELDKDASEIDFDNLYKYENGKNTTTKLNVNTLLTNYDNFYVYAVARNFNAMQANLKQDLGVANLADYVYFDAETCFKEFDEDKFAQYGYAWKRAEFKIYSTDSAATVSALTAQLDDDDVGVDGDGVNKYEVGQTINIKNVKVQWNGEVDGQMSVAVYHVQENNVLVPVNVVNSDNRNEAKVISSVAYCREEFTLENLYFTPDSKGDYIFVVTVKANASDKVTTLVKNIVIGASNEWSGSFSKKSTSTASSLSTASTSSSTSLTVGETLVLPTQYVGPDEEYVAKNRKFCDQSGHELGNYTITVLGVNDPNCLTGNKFTPNKTGRYILRHSYYLDGETEPEFEMDYDPIDVTAVTDGASNIRMGENYKAKDVLWNAGVTKILSGETGEVAGEKYDLGSGDTGTSKKPAYAITLDQFIMSNYGASTDFVVDSAYLYQYLEPLYEDGNLKGYMYPAIAIPMPNLISNNYSSDEVEITVQKSGSGDYLVSSKKKNAGGSNVNTKASVIENIDGFYVFRPEGKFSVECKDESKYNASNYLTDPNATNVVGVYTVTYKTQSTELSFNITFGNLENGELELKDGFLTYNNDDGNGDQEINSENTNDVVIEEIDGHRYVTIDMSKVNFTKNADMQALIAKGPNPDNDNEGYSEDQYETAYYWENARVTVSFEGSTFIDSTRWSDAEDETEAIKITDDGKFMYKFDLNQGSGTYKVNISLTNKYTKTSVSDSIEFTIDVDATHRSHNLNNVWGVILIVLSLGLLAGVVYYFIKTARATRFIDTPRAVKNKEKVKAPKAPKAEAPKEDVK